jgi:hypothetical protein
VFTDPLAGDVPNLLNRSSRPNQLMDIWATGIGAVAGNEAAMALPGDMANVPIEVWVGGRRANIVYRGRSGCCVGVDQIRFEVPSGVSGCYVPVVVVAGTGATAVVSNYTTISIAQNGGTCSDAATGGLSDSVINSIANGGTIRMGYMSLNRSATSFSFLGQTISGTTDTGSASFIQYDYNRLIRSSNAAGSITPFGSCYVFVYQGSSPPTDVAQPQPLDAGPSITINGPNGTKVMNRVAQVPGFYSAELGGGTQIPGLPGPAPTPLYLSPGTYTFTGTGGAQVGPINASMTVPAFVTWSNMASVSTINRANGQLITWTGGDPNSYVYISGGSTAGTAQNPVVASFTCYERASAGQFTIPAPVLLALPRTPTGAESFPGTLIVGSYTNPTTFSASGLDVGYMSAGSTSGKSVTFQ